MPGAASIHCHPDLRRGAPLLDPDFAGGLLETLAMRGVRSGSPRLPEGSPVLQMGRSRFLDCPFLAYVGRPGRYEF